LFMLEYAEPAATNCAQLAPTMTELMGIYSHESVVFEREFGRGRYEGFIKKINLRAEAD
jgi:hypothetical protein